AEQIGEEPGDDEVEEGKQAEPDVHAERQRQQLRGIQQSRVNHREEWLAAVLQRIPEEPAATVTDAAERVQHARVVVAIDVQDPPADELAVIGSKAAIGGNPGWRQLRRPILSQAPEDDVESGGD